MLSSSAVVYPEARTQSIGAHLLPRCWNASVSGMGQVGSGCS